VLEVHQRVHDQAQRRKGDLVEKDPHCKQPNSVEQATNAMSFYQQNVSRRRHSCNDELDDVVHVAREISIESQLLCFDELQVTDIADAMLMRRMLGELFASGCILVATSNRPPTDLYKGGINRESFMPAIYLLQAHCRVFWYIIYFILHVCVRTAYCW
jgi:predicted ATPase